MKKLLAVLWWVVLCIPLLTCDPAPTGNPPATDADWTILVYASGNFTTDNSHTIHLIQDLEKVGSSDKVQVAAMFSSPQTDFNARYYHIEYYSDEIGDNISSPMLRDKGGVDMSNPQSLADFISFGIENYPAARYALVVSGLAQGWPGACYDEHWGSGDHLMALPDLASGLEQVISAAGIGKFDLIFFNTPSMGAAETIYELRNSAEFMVASELNETMYDLPSGAVWLDTLARNSAMNGRELAMEIANSVYNTAADAQVECQISVIDIGKAGYITSAIANFADILSTSNDIDWNQIFECWRAANWASRSAASVIDLRQFVLEIEQDPAFQNIASLMTATDSLLSAIDNTVIFSESNLVTIPEIYLGGLTVYMPYQAADYDSTNYSRIDFHNCGWNDVISRFIASLDENPGYRLIVTVEPSNSGGWEATPFRDHYQSGDTVLLSAIPYGDYHFANWIIGGEYDYHKQVQTVFDNSDIDVTLIFDLPPSDSTVTVSGRVSWPGHVLSSHTYVFADTLNGYTPFLIGQADVNPANGDYTMVIENFRVPHQVTFEAQDDANNSGPWGELDAGDGWWFYDLNGDGIRNDLILLSPGQAISGIDIVLREYTPKR